MGITGILFNPNGRIGPNSFWRGVIVTFVLSLLVTLAATYVNLAIGMLSFLLIYPMICVYGKRLHDADKTAWLVIAVIIVSFVISYVLTLVISPMFGIDQAALQEQSAALGAEGDLAGVMDLAQQAQRDQMIPTLLISFITTFVVAFLVAQLPSNPETNQYGPPEGGAAAGGDTFS